MDELKRIAEILRPLWPGVVMVQGDCTLEGRQGRIRVEVTPGTEYTSSWCTVWVDHHLLYRVFWVVIEDAARELRKQRDVVHGLLSDMAAALGLEVTDG
jgi:hypothetical protein